MLSSHIHDKLVNELDIDGLILNYGVLYRSSYVCKYCGETIHTDFDESEMFDDDGNVIVQHGEIMLEEEITIQDDRNQFHKNYEHSFEQCNKKKN